MYPETITKQIRASAVVTAFRWTSKSAAQRLIARPGPCINTLAEDDAGNRTFALALDGLVMRSGVMTADKKFFMRDPKAA